MQQAKLTSSTRTSSINLIETIPCSTQCVAGDFSMYSVSSSVVIVTLSFADEYGIAADNLNILPADAYSFTLAAYSPEFRPSENNKSNHPSAAAVHLHIAHKPKAAAVGFIYNFLASQLRYTAIHSTASVIFLTASDIRLQYTMHAKTKNRPKRD